jgi:hypothetical protein
MLREIRITLASSTYKTAEGRKPRHGIKGGDVR